MVHTLQHAEFPDGMKVLNYGNIAGLLIEGIKAQDKRIDYLEAKLDMLQQLSSIGKP